MICTPLALLAFRNIFKNMHVGRSTDSAYSSKCTARNPRMDPPLPSDLHREERALCTFPVPLPWHIPLHQSDRYPVCFSIAQCCRTTQTSIYLSHLPMGRPGDIPSPKSTCLEKSIVFNVENESPRDFPTLN